VKKTLMMVLVVLLLAGITGYAAADPGIKATPESIGISTTTVVQATGSIISRTDLSMSVSSVDPVTGVPPLNNGAYYTAAYNEDTISNGVGVIDYTKLLDVDTANKNVNQYNIETFKQVTFEGQGSASMLTNENIYVSGTGYGYEDAASRSMCVFGSAVASDGWPAFCNSAEAGSSVDMRSGSVTTGSNSRFIMKSGDPGVELNHNIRVIDTTGKVSAYMKVQSMEGRAFSSDPVPFSESNFKETTTVTGLIELFDKQMHYESALRR